MDRKAVLYERVIWANALLRYFKNKPTRAVLEALGIDEQALTRARDELHADYVDAMARGDLELPNRQAVELGRATVAVAVAGLTLDDVRRLRAAGPRDELPLPDLVRILAAHALR